MSRRIDRSIPGTLAALPSRGGAKAKDDSYQDKGKGQWKDPENNDSEEELDRDGEEYGSNEEGNRVNGEKVIVINRKKKKKGELKCRMKLLSRPWGDDMGGLIGPWMIRDLGALREGEIYDVLCEDRLFYLAKALKIHPKEGTVEWYFPFWTNRHNYTGPLEDVYVAKKGHFTSKSGLSSKNVYLTVFNSPSRRSKSSSERHRFEAGQKYDPAELHAPRSIPARRRGGGEEGKAFAHLVDETPQADLLTMSVGPVLKKQKTDEKDISQSSILEAKPTLRSSSKKPVALVEPESAAIPRAEVVMTGAATSTKKESEEPHKATKLAKLSPASRVATESIDPPLRSLEVAPAVTMDAPQPLPPKMMAVTGGTTHTQGQTRTSAPARNDVLPPPPAHASSSETKKRRVSTSTSSSSSVLGSADIPPAPGRSDGGGQEKAADDVEASSLEDRTSAKDLSAWSPVNDKRLPNHVLLLPGVGNSSATHGGAPRSGVSRNPHKISSSLLNQDPLSMLSEVIFECRSLFPAPTVPKASGRSTAKPEAGPSFSEQQLRAIDSFLHLIRTPVFVVEEVKTLLQHNIYGVSYFMEENYHRREEAIFRFAIGILFVCSPHNSTMLYPRPQLGTTGRQVIDRTARTHFVSGDLSFGQALNLARNLYFAICPYSPLPLPRIVLEDARVSSLFSGLVLAASSEELASRLSIAPGLLGVAEGLKRLDIDGAALLQMSGSQLEYCLRDVGIDEWDLIKLDLDAFRTAAMENQFCPALWIAQIEMGKDFLEQDSERADAVRLLGSKLRGLYETQCGIRFDAPPKSSSSSNDSLAFMCPLLNGISYGAKIKMVEPIIPPRFKASKKRVVEEPTSPVAASHSLIVDSAALRAWDDLTGMGRFKWSPLSGLFLPVALVGQRKSVRITALD